MMTMKKIDVTTIDEARQAEVNAPLPCRNTWKRDAFIYKQDYSRRSQASQPTLQLA
jgi:hypothetical protein